MAGWIRHCESVASLPHETFVLRKKLHRMKEQQLQTKRACTEENVTAADELVLLS